MIKQIFEEQVQLTPDNLAVKTIEQQLTYAELNERANGVGREIQQIVETRDTVVALLFEHGVEMLVGTMGAVKGERVYLPLDPTYPVERLVYMLEDSGAGLIVTNDQNQQLAERLVTSSSREMQWLNLNQITGTDQNPETDPAPEEVAYILYTSGSTGQPKGVYQSYRNICHFVQNYQEIFEISSADRLTLFSSFGHDAAVMDIYSALLQGATLYPVDLRSQESFAVLADWLVAEQITVYHSVPTLYRHFVRGLPEGREFPALRWIILGGEAVLENDIHMFKAKFGPETRLANLYGQSESSFNSAQIFTGDTQFSKITLGEPVAETEVLLLQADGEEVDYFEEGEIVIASEYLALGYWGDLDRTQQVFTDDPLSDGRLYWTGDLGKMDYDGSIQFVGRRDAQVKIRGYRVELTEIESALLGEPAIREAAVIAHQDETGENLLTAYIVWMTPEAEGSTAEIRKKMGDRLPEYMIPANVNAVAALPKTATGKLDRKGLLELEVISPKSAEVTSPRNAVESGLATIWAEVLGKEVLGIDDDFFTLGGHSLKATALAGKIYQQFQVRVSLKEIFAQPTIRQLAELIEKQEVEQYREITPIEKQATYPVSSAQKRLYIMNQLDLENTNYNISGALRLQGQLDRGRLEKVIQQLVDRHEALRTFFTIAEGELVQQVADQIEFEIDYITFRESEMDLDLLVNGFIRPFDLSQAPLLRVGVVEVADQEQILIFDLHHIISDGTSMNILLREFVHLYQGQALPALKIQYTDYTVWQNDQLASEEFRVQEEYWLNRFAGQIPQLAMPLDGQRDQVQTFEGATLNFELTSAEMAQLEKVAQKENVTLYMILLAIYSLTLHKYTEQTDLTVGSIVAGRVHPDLHQVLGMFANFLPIRLELAPEISFTELLVQVRNRLVEAYEHQEYPFDRLVSALDLERDQARNPLFDTMLILHNEQEVGADLQIPGVEITPYDLEQNTSTLDFKMDLIPLPDGSCSGLLEYNLRLFSAESMAQLIGHFRQLIDLVLADREEEIRTYEIFSPEEKAELAKRREVYQLVQPEAKGARTEKKKIPVAISATFTAEPIADYLEYWSQEFELPVDLQFAGYNQVFQELLDSESLLSTNTGANLLLVRFEDWIRDETGSDQFLRERLEANFKQMIQVLRQKERSIPYLVGIFPISTHLNLSPALVTYLTELTGRWRVYLEEMENVHLLDFTQLSEEYQVKQIFDPRQDAAGHQPFTPEYLAALGTRISRAIYSWQVQHFKVIVLDCDNTLWQGVCGEDGTLGVKVSAAYQELQRWMQKKTQEGFILALCSKNNEADVFKVFAEHPDMILRKEDLAHWKINWQPKSANLKALAQELNLGLDSLIFIDDNPLECTEVMTNAPEVLTLQLPTEPGQIPHFLHHIWGLDRWKVTAEDAKRTQMYQAERERKKMEDTALTLSNFLQGLDLEMSMVQVQEEQIPRVSQLTQRTNQFNLSTVRRTEEEIRELMEREDYHCWVIHVRDRFGDYGLVGVVITQEQQEQLFLDTFLLSCRVLGRSVEEGILSGLRRWAETQGRQELTAHFYPTAKNQPFLEFLERTGWRSLETGTEYVEYHLPIAEIVAEQDYINFYFNQPLEVADGVEAQTVAITSSLASRVVGQMSETTESDVADEMQWSCHLVNEEKLLHRNQIHVLETANANRLVQLVAEQGVDDRSQGGYIPVQGDVEERLAVIWSRLLKVSPIGRKDHFFQVGGDSLKAVSLIGQIYKNFGQSLNLRVIFDYPVLHEMAQLLQEVTQDGYLEIQPVTEREYYPVSSAQKRLYLLNQIEENHTGYNTPGVIRLEGEIDRHRLQRALEQLITRHETLRSSFTLREGEPIQIIEQQVELPWEEIHASEEQNLAELTQQFIRPFDLSQAPLFRIALVEKAEQTYLMYDFHHIISDGTSLGIFFDELIQFYQGQELAPLRIQYKDYTVWQLEAGAVQLEAQEEFWLEQFSEPVSVLELPTDYPRPALMDYSGARYQFAFDEELTQGLKELALEHESTLYMVLLAGYSVLLSKYTGQDDLVVGTPIAGRTHSDLEDLLGIFINSLALRLQPTSNKSLQEHLAQVRETALQAFEHQEYPFESLVEKLNLPKAMNRNPLFDTLFALQNMQLPKIEIENLRLIPEEWEHQVSKMDLSIMVWEIGDRLECTVEYSTQLFREETIHQMAQHLTRIYQQMLMDLEVPIGDLEMLDEQEKELVLRGFNQTQLSYPEEKTVPQLFAEQVAIRPDQLAVICNDEMLTFSQLNAQVDLLAYQLCQSGIEKEQIVGIMLERSTDLLVAILAVLKAGGAFLPIDPEYPTERISYLFEDSQASYLITTGKGQGKVEFTGTIFTMDRQTAINPVPDHAQIESTLATVDGQPTDLAYLIYTSGSTGRPKGVMVEHRSLVNLTYAFAVCAGFAEVESVVALASVSFDMFLSESIPPLLLGRRVIIANEEEQRNPYAFEAMMEKHQPEVLMNTPSRIQLFLSAEDQEEEYTAFRSLKHLIFGGERLSHSLVDKVRSVTDAVIHNGYGPTETTMASTLSPLEEPDRSRVIPMGRPIGNTQIYILDQQLQPVPPKVVGEIYIAGAGVTRGYWQQPELTAERFVTNPWGPGKMYRSGDLARWLPSGNIEFVGRRDQQVKIRGHRIELGEIEGVLAEHPEVRDALLLEWTDPQGDAELCAYVVRENDAKELKSSQLQEFLATRLPDYMVPAYLIFIDQIPINANGKVDQRVLPEPTAKDLNRKAYVASRNAIEEGLVQIWSEILLVDKIGIHDNFFTIGGQSLRAVTLLSRIYQKWGVQLSLRTIFDNPTIGQLAEAVGNSQLTKTGQITQESILPAPAEEYYPLSAAQNRLYVLDQFAEHTAYNIPGIVNIEGELDQARLTTAFQELIQRHEVLRTSFVLVDEEPVQKIHPQVSLTIARYQAGNEREIAEKIQELIRPFDLSEAPLVRVGVIEAPERTVLVYDLHHIITDGISMEILLQEFMQLYSGVKLTPPELQYKDFAVWQKQFLQDETLLAQEAYWLDQFSGTVPVLNLPTDFPRPSVADYRGDRVAVVLEQKVLDDLNQLADEQGVTLYMILLAAYSVLLSRYTGQHDLIVGSPISGRQRPELESVVGMFVNTLAFRTHPEEEKRFSQVLAEVKETVLAGFENQDYQFESLVEKLGLTRDLSRNPLFDTMLVLQNLEEQPVENTDLTCTPYRWTNPTVKFDLLLTAVQSDDQLQLRWEYKTSLFKRETIQQMSRHFNNLLGEILHQPEQLLAKLQLLSPEEQGELLSDHTEVIVEYPRDKTLQQLFEEQVERTPDAVAISFRGETRTYAQLNQRANQLARSLRGVGVGPETLVGMLVDRSLEMITGVLAILKAGGAYLPIDPGYPTDRILYTLTDSGTQYLLVDPQYQEQISFTGKQIVLDEPGLYQGDDSNLAMQNQSSDLAYVIYTSGTTGQPKGVMIEHRNVVRLLINDQFQFDFSKRDIWTNFHSYCFDFSVWEMYGALLYGGKLIIIPKETAQNPQAFLQVLQQEKVTVLNQTPTAFYHLIQKELAHDQSLLRLRYVIFGGEALKPGMLEEFKEKYPLTRLINMYGITETTVHVTYKEITWTEVESNTSNIGTAIPTLRTYIMDQHQRLLPPGVPGELVVGGEGVARGYLNRPELTQKKFIQHPAKPQERMYLSGDLARLLPNGEMEYLGRIDRQVKIRGFRIEPGEIETKLLQHPEILETFVMVRQEQQTDPYLTAYLITRTELAVRELRDYLQQDLPDYMIPAYFVTLDQLPMTANGKIDQKALPAPQDRQMSDILYLPPTNVVEKKLVEMWQELLGVEEIGIGHNFFELGGHSLKATTLSARIQKELGVQLPLTTIFKRPTIAELAVAIEELHPQGDQFIERAPEQAYYPLSSAQKRLFLVDQLEEKGIGYNMPGVMILQGEVDHLRLEEALQKLVQRHESLRTSFTFVQGEPVQIVHDEVRLDVQWLEPAPDLSLQIQEWIKPFELSQAPLFRVAFIQTEEETIFVYDMHHIISDGTSLGILTRDFVALYEGQELPPLGIQYRDYAIWHLDQLQSDWMQAKEAYWLEQFQGELPVLNLPTDFSIPANRTYAGDQFRFKVDAELTRQLKELAGEEEVTLFMLLLAQYNLLLSRYSGQEDLVIGTPVAGRNHADLEELIGLFLNTVALRNQPVSDLTFSQFLLKVKENTLQAFDNQDYQFEMLIEKLGLKKEQNRNPLFNTMFIMQNMDHQEIATEELQIRPYTVPYKVAKFDLTLVAFEEGEELQLILEYSTQLFREATIAQMAQHLLQLLQSAVANPDQQLQQMNLLTEAEKQELVYDFECITDAALEDHPFNRFAKQVQLTPEAIALTFGREKITYQALALRVERLARILQEKRISPGCGSIVGLLASRRIETIVAMLAIFKTGGIYLPIDPTYPEDRIDYMLQDSDVQVLITQTNLREKADFSGEVIELDQLDWDVDDAELTATYLEPVCYLPNNLAYIIYTSGSTGRPKGVEIEYQSMHYFMDAMSEVVDFDQQTSIVFLSALSFDLFVVEVVMPLSKGGLVVIASEDEQRDPAQFKRLLQRNQVDIIQTTPARLQLLLGEGDQVTDISKVKKILLGGEAFPEQLLHRLKGLTQARLINVYGPTETTVWATSKDLSHTDRINIGLPLKNVKVYILDQNLNPLPKKVAGEMYISGTGVGRGYLNRPDLTLDRFVDNPWLPGMRMYKTGDLARWSDSGEIEFLGRTDFQVKIRGYRIELGEIEGILQQHPEIKEAVVVARGGESSEQHLCAFFTAPEELTVSQLRGYLATQLPDYMIPAYFVQLEEMPLTPNGKIDRKGLPDSSDLLSVGTEYIPPQDALEELIIQIWASELDLEAEQIGRTDHFFELGGSSLSILRVTRGLNQELDREISMGEIFTHPVVADLADYLRTASALEKLRCLVPLNQSKTKSNLFIIHGLDGTVYPYKDLAKLVEAEYQVYGIQSRGLTTADPLPDTVKETLSEYIQEIKEVQPEGPYLISGYCIGSILAYELVRMLEDQGDEVTQLIMFDEPAFLPRWALKLLRMKESVVNPFRKLPLLSRKRVELVTGDEIAVSTSESIDAEARKGEIKQNNEILVNKKYLPKRVIYSPTLVLKAQDTKASYFTHWDEMTDGLVRVVETPGNHNTIFAEPHVAELALILLNELS